MDRSAYDFIVVGGGSAGCVLANRLSTDRGVRMLVLEAGLRDRDPIIHMPLGVGRLRASTRFDWKLESEPEPNLDGRILKLTRGKVLGGSSSVNMMVYTRGDASDYDRWSENGATGWSFREVLPYFKRSERWERGTNEVRGGDGPLGVTEVKLADPLTEAWLAAASTHGYRYNAEPASGDIEGFSRTQLTISRGRRASAAAAYLRPALRRRNLHVRTGVRVMRIVFDGTRAAGVEYLDERSGRTHVALAEREIVLCAGTYNSPQLLMLSGIGPASHLKEVGITPLLDLPVGQNLQDHPSVLNVYERRTSGPFHAGMRFDRLVPNFMRAVVLRSGPAATLPLGLLGFVKMDPSDAEPGVELIFALAPVHAAPWFPGLRAPYADALSIRSVVLHPESRGDVRLSSADATAPVRVRHNLLATLNDVSRQREAFRLGRSLAYDAALDALRGSEISPGSQVQSDADLDAYIRKTLTTVAHPIGTCRMGTGPDTVVDPELRVHGTKGLRVVDASIMPDLPSAHINAAVLMIAEKAADLIRS
jgi:4-pyridoxate dehydrogenase